MGQKEKLFKTIGLIVLAFAVCGGISLFAQVDAGTITGTVKDPSGAVIPGATVNLINQGTNFKLTATTDSSGGYTFTPIHIGTYTVEASFRGFQQAVHKDVLVQVTEHVDVSFTLQPGAVTQTVEVTAAPPLLQTGSASTGQIVGQRSVNNLPLNGRNYTFLAQLAAGVTTGGQEGRGLNATGTFSANGVRPAQNNYLLDGMDDNADLVDFLNSTSYVMKPPVDSIQEFKVQTSNYSAEFGRAGGAILNATTKSGANQVHGDAWEFIRNSGLDARNFFERSRGEFRQNQFGATLGGPVVIPHIYNGHNKTFFFLDYEGTRVRQATPYTRSVPTAEERASGFTDFSELIADQTSGKPQTDALGRSFPLGTIFDPATTQQIGPGTFIRQPFANNQIPVNRINPNVVKLLSLYPAPNVP
ncbi:MAG: carboxypeptidase regulatory-like domain-containing protein, partial [Acidobacteriota bacterium]|nr:carboxypeptidase regulatory-like domain-containing protein [Acidobacteriota bacterium]